MKQLYKQDGMMKAAFDDMLNGLLCAFERSGKDETGEALNLLYMMHICEFACFPEVCFIKCFIKVIKPFTRCLYNGIQIGPMLFGYQLFIKYWFTQK